MKNILLIIIFLALSNLAFADVYVITDSIGSIYSLSEQDDAVLPVGYSKDIIRGKNISDLALDSDVSIYKYSSGKFSIDTKKVAEKRQKEADIQKAKDDAETAKKSAMDKLKKLGLADNEISALIGK